MASDFLSLECPIQVGQLVVMAQAGLWVPAQRMRLRPADAIFTRMGAYDSILQGRSTFLEELRDASALLAAATPSSLVIVDELGRGTATHDGVAIAVSTLQHLVVRQKCCTLYSTHYPEVRTAVLASSHLGHFTRYKVRVADV